MRNGALIIGVRSEQRQTARLKLGTSRIAFEDEQVPVFDVRVPLGHTGPLQTHRWSSALYILSWSDFTRCEAEGTIVMDSRGMTPLVYRNAIWSPALIPHTLENIGEAELHVIAVEVKNA
jgi:hypothetical protein